MDYQNVDCQKCGCTNKLGTIFCRNCGTKLKFNKFVASPKNQQLVKTVKRAVNVIIGIIVLVFLIAAFCPYGFNQVPKITDPEEKTAVINTCIEIDRTLARSGKVTFEFTSAEATMAANYLAAEHEKPKKDSFGFGSGSKELGGVTKLSSQKSSLGKNPSMNFESEKSKKIETKLKQVGKKVEEEVEDVSFFDFAISVKDDKTLSVAVKDKWLNFIPARLELNVVPKLNINVKERTETLEYELSSARFGFLPLPLFLKEQILMLFEEMLLQEREFAKQYFQKIINIEIEDNVIKVTFQKK